MLLPEIKSPTAKVLLAVGDRHFLCVSVLNLGVGRRGGLARTASFSLSLLPIRKYSDP